MISRLTDRPITCKRVRLIILNPLNNIWEVVEGSVFGSIARVISVYVLISWDKLCDGYIRDRVQPQEPCGLNTALFVSARDSAQHGGCIRYASAGSCFCNS